MMATIVPLFSSAGRDAASILRSTRLILGLPTARYLTHYEALGLNQDSLQAMEQGRRAVPDSVLAIALGLDAGELDKLSAYLLPERLMRARPRWPLDSAEWSR